MNKHDEEVYWIMLATLLVFVCFVIYM